MDIQREIEILSYLLEQIIAITEFTKGMSEDAFLRDEKTKNAVMMKLIVLGEYSVHVDNELKNRFSEVQWQLIKAARNYYTHVYRGVDWIKVWEVVVEELPGLKNKLENIIEVLEEKK